jgi:hypothetical protein
VKRFLSFAAAASIAFTPVAASDFSFMSKPEFARALLMSEQRREEIRCTLAWVKSPGRQALAPLVAEIDRRGTIELGSREQFDERDRKLAEGAGSRAEIAIMFDGATTRAPERCKVLEEAFANGGMAAAEPLLAPAPTGPISLPSIGHCLAQIENGPMATQDSSLVDDVRKMRKLATAKTGFSVDELAAIDRDYASYRPDPAANAGNGEIRDLVCFPVIAELSRRTGFADQH